MKKLICAIVAIMLTFTLALGLCACGETETPSGGNETPGTEQPSTPGGDTEKPGGEAEKPADPAKANFTGLTMSDVIVTYDGTEHVVTISGEVPEGASVVYENNKATNAGTYNVKATVTKDNYNTLVLNAKLVINKANFTGLTMSDVTVTYDGTEHVVTISGEVQGGASVVYENNKATNAGTYNVKATVTKDNYNTLVLNAKLVINKANIADGLLTLSDETVEYDGLSHTLAIVGNVPDGCTVTYLYNGENVDGVTDGGEHIVTAVVEGANYNKRTYTAKLTIKTTQKQLYSAMLGGAVYFQNPLDGDTLYKYYGTSLTRVNKDEAEYMTVSGDALYYTSKGLFGSNIKKLTSSENTAVYSASGEYITVSDGYIYYAVNGLLGGEKNGIYRYSLSAAADETATQLYQGKASWLTVYGGNVYFAAGASKGKLMSVPVGGGTATSVADKDGLLAGKNVAEMTLSGDTLFLNIGTTTSGYAIFRINLADANKTAVKMTTDAGKNLTVIGNNLYYINNDLLTSNVFGKGVCTVTTSASGSLPGTKLVDENVYSLTGDGNNLYYYRDTDKHLMKYSLSAKTAVDVMENFVPVEDNSVMGYAVTKEYKGEIYYVNPRDNGAIYKYNSTTRGNFKVIADSCADFWFDGDYMYYSTYNVTNYDLYKREMKSGAEAVRVSKNRVDALTIAGDYIYYVDNGGTANRIRKVAKTSSDFDTDSVQVGKDNVNWQALEVVGDKLYYCINPTVGHKKFCYIDVNAGEKVAGTEVTYGETFTYLNGKFYVYNQKDKKIYSYDPNGGATAILASNVEIVDMISDGTNVYYASNTKNNEGLYKLTVATGESTKIHKGAVDGLGATSKGITFLGVKITYGSEMPVKGQVTGTGYLYLYNGTSVTALNKK